MPEDQHTFQQLQAVANSLDKDIQMTIDTPSSNGEGRLPVLDLELWIEQDQIKHTFYQKPMSSPYQIHFRSALARKSKRETLLQEGIRRLRNMGPDVSDLEKQTVMSKYMNSLRISGYDQSYRYLLLKGILNLNVRQEGEIVEGKRSRYRSRDEILSDKEKKFGKFPATWFLRGEIQNTLKVQATPDSGLVSALKKEFDGKICTEGGATKFVELGGKQITSGLSKPECFTANQGCVFEDKCMINPESDCRVTRTIYSIECIRCKEQQQQSVYIGTSGRQLHLRQLEHASDIRHQRRSNALFKHSTNAHPGENVQFMANPLVTGIKYNLDRFIFESIKISENYNNNNVNLLNSRAEWGHRGLPRLTINQN